MGSFSGLGPAGLTIFGHSSVVHSAARITASDSRNSGELNAGHVADQGTYGRYFVGPKEGWEGRPSRRLRQDQAHQTKFTRRPAPSLHPTVVGRPRRSTCPPQQVGCRRDITLAARRSKLAGGREWWIYSAATLSWFLRLDKSRGNPRRPRRQSGSGRLPRQSAHVR